MFSRSTVPELEAEGISAEVCCAGQCLEVLSLLLRLELRLPSFALRCHIVPLRRLLRLL